MHSKKKKKIHWLSMTIGSKYKNYNKQKSQLAYTGMEFIETTHGVKGSICIETNVLCIYNLTIVHTCSENIEWTQKG